MRLLEVFCGEGGSSMGYAQAGFEVFGVDNDETRLANYPFDHTKGDAIEFILKYGHEFDVIHGGPTCTGYSQGTVMLPDRLERYDRLIPQTRAALQWVGKPYVIENVYGARRELIDPIMLCWREFHRPVIDTDGTPLVMNRHRMFESNLKLVAPPHPKHDRSIQVAGSYGGARRDKQEAREIRKGGYVPKSVDVLRELIGAPWMTERGLFLAVPPSYTHYLGKQIIDLLGRN